MDQSLEYAPPNPDVQDAPEDEASGSEPRAAPAEDRSIGRIVSVSGSQVVMLLYDRVDGNGAPENTLHIGALVKVRTAASIVFGMVSGLSVPIPAHDSGEKEILIAELELVGESIDAAGNAGKAFRRGVSFHPALRSEVLATTHDDLRLVYAQPNVSNVRVGTIYQDKSLPAYVAVDDLLGKHFAVLGTTGTGKSCAVAMILRAILAQHGGGHVLLLDLHNEYSQAFSDCGEIIGPGSLELPYWMLSFEEIREIVIGDSNDDRREADAAILKTAILESKRLYLGDDADASIAATADTAIPYRLSDLTRFIDDALGKLNKATDSAPFLRLKERLRTLSSDKRYSFMFPGLTIKDNMAAILSRIFRIPVRGKPLTIVDLSGVPSEILNVVVSLLCRLTFDFALCSERAVPILLVCEEAHRYVNQSSTQGFEPTKRALSRIAKEGRKYGVSLCVISQRPADLAVGILSQCNTIFALRMSNQSDQEFVRGTLSESAMGLLDVLPTLRTGEAIAVGEGVPVPVRLNFDLLPEDQRPHSGTASFSTSWQSSDRDEKFVDEIVARWRRERR